MSIQPVHVAGDGLVWSCEFYNSLCVSDQGGVVIAGAPVINKGVTASGDNTDLIRFSGNATNLLIGATRATWRVKFRTGANVFNDNMPLTRYTAAGNGSFWFGSYGAGVLDGRLANPAGADRIHRYTGILANSEYDFTFTYSGPGARFLAYLNGAPVAFPSASGAFPASLNIYNGPLEVFGLAGVKYARTGFKLYAAYVFDFEMDAAAVADWYAKTTNREITP
ncbi:MAG: hypothetical protein WC683_02345 [bacterium]